MGFGHISKSQSLLCELMGRHPALSACESSIEAAFEMISESYRKGCKLLVCGNGGSAADCEHIVGELMKSFKFKRAVDPSFAEKYAKINGCDVPSWLEGSLPAISLVSQTALSTAICNDETSVGVFAQQVYGYGSRNDVLIAISTSGNSANVIEAARVARAKGMMVISLTGFKETELTSMADIAIKVPESETFKVQELHLPVYHCLCAMVEAELFGEQ